MSHHYIKYSDVHFAYPGGPEVLRGVDLLITHGEKVALLGLNGSGKSTLLLTLNGLLMPQKGEVNVGDVPLCKKTLKLIRRTVGMVFQDADDMLFMPTLEEDVAFGPLNMGLPYGEVRRRVEESLGRVGLTKMAGCNPAHLSGGQKRMGAIASVLSMEPDILVLDEPSANLDLQARSELEDIINGFRHTVILATHDLELAAGTCSRALVIEGGRIAADIPMGKLMQTPELLARIGKKNKML